MQRAIWEWTHPQPRLLLTGLSKLCLNCYVRRDASQPQLSRERHLPVNWQSRPKNSSNAVAATPASTKPAQERPVQTATLATPVQAAPGADSLIVFAIMDDSPPLDNARIQAGS